MSILNTVPEVALRGASPLILLDSDYLAYMIGGISQAKEKNPEMDNQTFECINEEKDLWVWADPIQLVTWRVDNEIEKIKDRLRTNSCEVWLTPHQGNFRESVAVTKPYKGGRTSVKPYHYTAIRDHLRVHHGAQVAVDCEADDMVCTRQMDCFREGEKSVIVGPDKDLKCMFGHHYNPQKDIEEWITWEEAAINFYGQMVTGDTVDNIPGAWRKGKSHVAKLAKQTEGLTGDKLVDAWHIGVAELYHQAKHDEEYWLEQANLLHMRRNLNEKWNDLYDWEDGYDVNLR